MESDSLSQYLYLQWKLAINSLRFPVLGRWIQPWGLISFSSKVMKASKMAQQVNTPALPPSLITRVRSLENGRKQDWRRKTELLFSYSPLNIRADQRVAMLFLLSWRITI